MPVMHTRILVPSLDTCTPALRETVSDVSGETVMEDIEHF